MTSPLLRPDEWLEQQPEEFISALNALSKRRFLSAGTTLYRTEDWGGIYGLHSGCLEITISFACSNLTALHFAYPGYFIGNRPIETGAPYAVSVAARLDCEVDALAFTDICQMVKERPEWWRCFATITDHWFDVATCSGMDLMLRSAEARCIAVLLRMGGYRPFTVLSEVPRFIPITQQELADNANLSRSSVNETLGNLERAGIVTRSYGGITVELPGKLQERVEALSE